MDTMIKNGDHVKDERGIPKSISGIDEIIQEMIIRLTIPKGSFALDKNIGSMLHTISRLNIQKQSELATRYVQSALIDMQDIKIESVECKYNHDNDMINIFLTAMYNKKNFDLEVSI